MTTDNTSAKKPATTEPTTTMPAPTPKPTTEELQRLVDSLDDVNTTKIPVVRVVPVEG